MKAYKNEFDRLYEKLSKLFEAIDSEDEDDAVEIDTSALPSVDEKTAADRFWASLKTDAYDLDSFHMAYDRYFTDEFKEKNFKNINSAEDRFEVYGPDLKGKWTYGAIKELDPDLPSTKAIKKLWAAKYVDHKPSQTTVRWEAERDRKYKEAQKAKAEAHQKKLDALSKELQKYLDLRVIERVLEISEDPADIMPYYYDTNFCKVTNTTGYSVDGRSPAELAKLCNAHYKKRLEQLEAKIDYSLCSWFKPMIAWCENARKYKLDGYITAIFQDAADKVYEVYLDRNTNSLLEDRLVAELKKSGAPIKVDLVAFRYVASDDGGNSYRDSHNDTYVSLSDKANAEARKLSGVNTAPATAPSFEFFGDIGKWKEETKAEAEKRVTFLVDGMDKWYSQSTTYYATESLKEGVDAEEA